MNRIKVVNDITDLVPVLRAVDSDDKLAVFEELSKEWVTEDDIRRKFGEKGVQILNSFERMKLIDSRWITLPTEKEPVQSYHSYYSTVSISTTASLADFSDVLSVATMEDKDYAKEEKRIIKSMGEEESRFFTDVATDLGMSPTRLKGLVKRSEKLNYHGHRIEHFKKTKSK